MLTDLSNDLFFDYLDVLDLNQYLNMLIIDRHLYFHANMIGLNSYGFFIYEKFILPMIGSHICYLSISDEFNYLKIILH